MELLLSFIAGLFIGLFIGYLKISGIIKGDLKTKGVWGEMVLERILEASGLQKGVHYMSQESYKNGDNAVLRPDVVINLPNNRHIIIDSKTSFELNSTRDHIKGLKNKFYDQIKELNSPDFVIMFIPVESVFSDIMKKEIDIFEFGWRNKVLITGPSTIIATLKTIELSWQQENQTRNVTEIAEESGKLYDKFVGLVSDLETVKNRFEDMSTKLEGRGGLIRQAEKIKALGARASKRIPEKHLMD